jgi:hypothetical protein
MLNGLKSRQHINASQRTRIVLASLSLWLALDCIGVDENTDVIRTCRLAQLELPRFSYAAATVGKAKRVSQSTPADVINCQCVPEVIVNRSSETQTEFQQQAVGEKQSGKNTSSNPVEAAAIADNVNPNRQKQLGQLITSSAGNNQSKSPKQSDQAAASAGYIHPNSQQQSGETTTRSDETSQSESKTI